MSDKEGEEQVFEKPFHVDRAKTGRAGCKKCKQKISQGELRFAKLASNPFGSGTIKQWHHIQCIFEVFKKQRASTKKVEHPDDIGGWENLNDCDQQEILNYFSPELQKVFADVKSQSSSDKKSTSCEKNNKVSENYQNHKDNSFKMFRKLCADLANDSSYLTKTKIIADFFDKGSDGQSFKSNIELWCRLLLPNAVLRVYNLQSKQLIKLFSKLLETDQEEMLEDLEKGDVAETISSFFKSSKKVNEADKSTLTLQEVDEFLEKLSTLTKEDEQGFHFKKILQRCTSNDLKIIIRLIKHDLRINAGPKHILEALHKDAYKAFQTSRDIKSVVSNALKAREVNKGKSKNEKLESNKGMDIIINMMTPVLPMLAQPCKSIQMALEKCPNGMYSEIKYDGERVQLHKQGNTFKYFSRSLKPVLSHKVNHFKDYIPKAFPHAQDLILDAEILMVDNNTGKPLPFGTLGIHKKSEFKNANVCLFVFDCMYYNGKSLLQKPIKERKEILHKNMVEVANHIMFSEMKVIHDEKDLEKMMTNVFKLGLEGLVLKDKMSMYEPGKRHWLKVKKDYLYDGAMADSADLVVLGAWFGTGCKGGIMSSFLMGCYDSSTKKWVTVTKVSSGHDDETLENIQKQLNVIKISKDSSKVPKWLNCTKTMIPDFVASDPRNMPVWEITGAEFTRNQVHTANGISIRFPRVTKIRSDKDWTTATDFTELKMLYQKSRDPTSFSLNKIANSSSTGGESTEDDNSPKKPKKRKHFEDKNTKQTLKKSRVQDEDEDEDNVYLEETDVEEENVETKLTFSNPLPNIFTGCVIQIPKEYKNYDLLRRYLIAYDATIHDIEKKTSVENSNAKVTHVVHLNNTAAMKDENYWSKKVRHVHINWIWDSIKLLERQPECVYTVTAKQKN